MPRNFKCTYRGDTRSIQNVRNAGGFVPKYLLEHHNGGFAGFVACKNKVPGVMGCKCSEMNPSSLYARARIEFDRVLRDPSLLNSHIIYNKSGYLSTAIDKDDMYKLGEDDKGAHSYAITSFFEPEFKISNSEARIGVKPGNNGKVSALRDHTVYCVDDELLYGKYLAIAAKNGSGGPSVELTYFTPVPALAITDL